MKATSRPPTRPYRMRARAEAAERTAAAILDATVELWRDHALDAITLQMIAERAGVTEQTVIRRFGSKDGVIDAGIRSDAAKIVAHRAQAPVGDVGAALEVLFDHYEQVGDAVVRTLDLQERYPAAKAITDAGRAEHRAWCERVFAPYLPDRDAPEYGTRVDAFVAATDLYLWKLLRRDLSRSSGEALRAVRALVDGLTRPQDRGEA